MQWRQKAFEYSDMHNSFASKTTLNYNDVSAQIPFGKSYVGIFAWLMLC